MKIVKLTHNPVQDFLMQNKGKKLSIKTIKKNLKLNYRELFFYIKNSDYVKNVPPIEVGSGSKFLHIYQYEKQD